MALAVGVHERRLARAQPDRPPRGLAVEQVYHGAEVDLAGSSGSLSSVMSVTHFSLGEGSRSPARQYS